MQTAAIVFDGPGHLALRNVELLPPSDQDIVVDVDYSAISTGTEKLIWTGAMPHFPGMGYPLVPGYEAVGRVVEAGASASCHVGDTVFVPGSSQYVDVRGLFGAAARRVVTRSDRVARIDEALGVDGTLLALAATAYHAVDVATAGQRTDAIDLIVGHGVLGRLIARICALRFETRPTVWEQDPNRRQNDACPVIDPAIDERRDYGCIIDASGDPGILDTLTQRIRRGGLITLAGFYSEQMSFTFPPAFMKEARFAIAAEWQPQDLATVIELIHDGRLDVSGLISDQMAVQDAQLAYHKAFTSPSCIKMAIDWRGEA